MVNRLTTTTLKRLIRYFYSKQSDRGNRGISAFFAQRPLATPPLCVAPLRRHIMLAKHLHPEFQTARRQSCRQGWCTLLIGLLCLAFGAPSRSHGDQFVLTSQSQPQRIGEIQLLPGPLPMHEGRVLPLLYSGDLEPADNAISAGELWSFFERQGLTKVESIVLFLDVDKFSGPDPITIQSIEFRIEPVGETTPVTSCSLGESNRLIIPGDDSLAALPEARLEIPLNYDFMQRFSATSTEKVFLKLAYQAPAGTSPSFFVAGKRSWFTLPNLPLLAGFVAFWGFVFFLLARLTLKPTAASPANRRVS